MPADDEERPLPPAPQKAAKGVAAAAARVNRDERLLALLRRIRSVLPGDDRFGDPLSTSGGRQADVVARQISRLNEEQPRVLREAGLGALQVWQALAEAQGRGRGDVELAIVFTDLAGFSTWALEAGDEPALELLRAVSQATEPPVRGCGGRVVKRLGDGMMAVFSDPQDALAALLEGREELARVEVAGFRPRMRAGIHLGKPRKIGGDYLGIDVNIAARVAEAASTDAVLVTDTTLAALDTEGLDVRKQRLFRAKGVPRDVSVFSVRPKR